MQTNNPWPMLILSMAVGFLILSVWSFHRAAQDTSAITDADYYSHGLRYNQTLLEKNAATSLGWSTVVTLGVQRLQVVLTDRDHQPVSTAHGTLTLHGGNHAEEFLLPLTEGPEGLYFGVLPEDLHGERTGQIDFELGSARLSQRLLLSLP